MKRSRLNPHALGVIALLLAGCGSQVGPTGGIVTGTAFASHGKSWMLPGTSGDDLIYLGVRVGSGERDVYVFSYTTGKLVGELTGFRGPQGLCVDKSGDVWVVDYGGSRVDEYAHGGTSQIASLTVPGSGPYGCSVDPATGNLAVTYDGGNIAVFPNAQGTPVTYSDDYGPTFYYCTYDNASNLFISDDWARVRQKPQLYELPDGSSKLTVVSLDKNVRFRDVIQAIQWDGKAFAYGGARVGHKGHTIYQLTISGNEAKRSGTTQLLNSGAAGNGSQFWVQGNSVVQAAATQIGVWDYPGGGKPTKRFTVPATSLSGIAISDAASSK